MAADSKSTCNGMFAFRIVDTVALVVAVALQGLAFNNFFIHEKGDEDPLWYLLYGADALMVLILITASVLSYRSLLDRFHAQVADIDIPHIDIPMYGVLPFGYITWLLYAVLLTTKIALFFDNHLEDCMSVDGTEGGLLSSAVFKLVLAASSVVFVLLVNTHHDAEPHSFRSAYIADLCKGTTFDIMDSVAFLAILLPEYALPVSYQSKALSEAIIVFACINLFLPTLALMKLSLSDFCQAGHPMRLELLYKTGRLFLIDLPYMVVRLYLWNADRSVSLFLIKNMLYVLINVRYLLPEYVAVVRQRRRVAATATPSAAEDAGCTDEEPNTVSANVL